MSSAGLNEGRRTRVTIQVLEKWTNGGARLPEGKTEDEAMLTVIAAADATFEAKINDLDWEAATLARLQQGEGQ